MPRKLSESVVVITGASSGFGRATARHFAAKGASLVLAARREDALHEVVVECEQAGGRAIAVLTDVSDQLAVEAIARLAIEAFGRIDVWVNNAAVTLFGRFEETPIEDYRRVFETNVFGYIYGARAALPIFREQGSGVLINVSSVVTRMPQPYTSAYTMSKHAIRALSMSLRQELALDGAKDIHVCTVMPATIDTPFFQHAANFTGRTAKAMPPVYPAENVARMIVRMAERPKREVYVGNAGRLVNLEMKVMPALAERLAATMVYKEHLGDTPAAPTSGNLFEPVPEWNSVDGGWKPNGSSPIPRAAVLGAIAVPVVVLMRRRMNDSNGLLIDKLPKPSRSKLLVRRVLS